jgi:F-type H+-transporting ATPase subunit b
MEGVLGDPTFWVAVGLVVFLAVVLYFGAHKTVARMLDERAAGIKRELEEARKLREEAQALLQQYQGKQRDAEKEAEAIVAQARVEAERIAKETQVQLEQLIERRTKAAQDKISQVEAEAAAEVRTAAVGAAVAASEALIKERLSAQKSEELVEKAIGELRGKLH